MTTDDFHRNILELDCHEASARIERALRDQVGKQLRRRGLVLGVSGGVDSAVCATLAARALGPERVTALLMPEHDSPDDATHRATKLCEMLAIEHLVENIAPTLEALGCYRRRDEAIRRLFPDFGPDCRCKIVSAGDGRSSARVNYFDLVVELADGTLGRERMPLDVYLAVVAATNMKQRTRKLLEYYHAERQNYAVLGTPNRLEYQLGFFVRGGDGLADVKPIAHLYKTQVYQLARHLGVPEEICEQVASTDTYSLPQTQEEFYFALPHGPMDLLLYADLHGIPASVAAPVVELESEQVEEVYRDIALKRRSAARLDQSALFVEQL